MPLSGAATRHLPSMDSFHWGTATQGVGVAWALPGVREHLGEDGSHVGLESLEDSEKQQHVWQNNPPLLHPTGLTLSEQMKSQAPSHSSHSIPIPTMSFDPTVFSLSLSLSVCLSVVLLVLCWNPHLISSKYTPPHPTRHTPPSPAHSKTQLPPVPVPPSLPSLGQ